MGKKNASHISDFDAPAAPRIPGLFDNSRLSPTPDHFWPDRYTDEGNFYRILSSRAPYKGIDLEFKSKEKGTHTVYTPTIVSIAQQNEGAVLYSTPEVIRNIAAEMRSAPGTQWVAHSAIAADKDVVDAVSGIETPLDRWDCSMVSHYCTHQHLTKNPAKAGTDDAGALGFMGLHHAAMLGTKLPGWKFCSGAECQAIHDESYPCPTHRPRMYCLVDTVAGLQAHLSHIAHPSWNHSFYRDRVAVTDLCLKMQRKGIAVDRKYVSELNTYLSEKKGLLFSDGSYFNPNSPEQVLSWFSERGVYLKGSTKKDVEKELDIQCGEAGIDPQDIDAAAEGIPEVVEALHRLHQWKTSGKGLDSWFAEKFFYPDGKLHPRFVAVGASSGRLSCVAPNFMNVAARRWGALVRGGVIPRDPGDDWIKADFGQLELRMCLYLAGIEPPKSDCFLWMIDTAGEAIANAAQMSNPEGYAAKPETAMRDMLKVASHSADYLSGIRCLSGRELALEKAAIDYGALVPYTRKYVPWLDEDWTFMGKVVCFTGANLADTLFGVAPRTIPWQQKWERRKKALLIQEQVYFAKFSAIRKWHMKILREAESGFVKTPSGAFMELWGTPEERAKVVAMSYGQGCSAHFVQEKMLEYYAAGEIPTLQVHDEINTEKPSGWTDAQVKSYFLDVMSSESKLIPGFSCPASVYRGGAWVEWDGEGERGKAKFGDEWREVPRQMVKIHGVPKR